MINPKQPPYPPGDIVYFTDRTGVKKGKVIAINILIEDKGIKTDWAIAETTKTDNGDIETIVHQRELSEIAKDWENIKEKAEKTIFSFKQQPENNQNDDEFIF